MVIYGEPNLLSIELGESFKKMFHDMRGNVARETNGYISANCLGAARYFLDRSTHITHVMAEPTSEGYPHISVVHFSLMLNELRTLELFQYGVTTRTFGVEDSVADMLTTQPASTCYFKSDTRSLSTSPSTTPHILVARPYADDFLNRIVDGYDAIDPWSGVRMAALGTLATIPVQMELELN